MPALIPFTDTVVANAAQLNAYGPIFAQKASDQTIASNTTFQNDSALFATVQPNATYRFELVAIISASNASNGGMKVQFTIPTGATMPDTMFRWGGNATPLITGTNGAVTGLSLTTSLQFFEEQGLLIVGGTGGTMQFQWAQNSSSVNNSIVGANSFLNLRQVA